MARKRLLTWHRPSRRWKKQVGGVVYYFGYGQSERDTRSYKDAEHRYLDFLARRDKTQTIDVALADATLGDICEKFAQHLEQRCLGKQITPTYLKKVEDSLNAFLTYVGQQVQFGSVRELLLEDYRNHVMALPVSDHTKKPISPSTARERLVQVKALFQWSYEMNLCDLPRNMRRYSQVDLAPPCPARFSRDEIQTLWKAASPRMRCFMALGLNCGHGQQDIADLRVKEIDFENGYIERERSKTGVWARHKLWPVTLTLIKEQMVPGASGDDLVFMTAAGHPLVHNEWKDGKLRRSDSVACMFRRLMKKVGLDGGRSFYSLRKTGASEIEMIDPAVTDMYLAHAVKGMRKHYAERNWGALDEAIDALHHDLEISI